MFRLTRQVRLAVNYRSDPQLHRPVTNGYAGFPTLTGLGTFLSLDLTLSGPLDPVSGYLVNIRQIDSVVRELAIPVVSQAFADQAPPARLVLRLSQMLDAWPPLALDELKLSLSPFLNYVARPLERPMVRLSQKFEFSATHRLHNPRISEAENRRIFGKCNNPHGHGHNYEVQVTLKGEADANGVLIDIPEFEKVVASTVIDRFDHRNLNIEIDEFRERIPTVENIAQAIYRLLKPAFASRNAALASVTVWETPKTWCEYCEE